MMKLVKANFCFNTLLVLAIENEISILSSKKAFPYFLLKIFKLKQIHLPDF